MLTQKQIYNLAVKMGAQADLRGMEEVRKVLLRARWTYEKLDYEHKLEYDGEKMLNPYSDTRILNKTDQPIKRVLAGIDIGVDELLLADKLGGFDLVISHHPLGIALADLSDVMHLQAQVLAQYGVPINIAQGVMRERIEEVSRGVSASNHQRVVDAAKLLNMALMCIHTPCDNLAASYLDQHLKKDQPETLADILKSLKKIPEYKRAVELKAGPRIFVGSPENFAGKIALTEITGGTEGAKEIYSKMAQAGIGTVIGMHMAETHRKEAQKSHVNVVVAGHISSDSLGFNQLLDVLEKQGVEVVPCSGLIRIKREISS